MGQVVAFYSFKGGVGRSLLLANVAVSLAQSDLRIMCVDFDLASGGLHTFFGFASKDIEKTLLDLFNHLSPEDIARVVIDVTKRAGVSSKNGKIWLLPTVAEPAKLSFLSEVSDDLGARIAVILDEADELFRPDFVLVDCASGFSDLASGPILKANYLICVLKANRQDAEGIRMLLDILETVGNSPTVLLALNQLPNPQDPEMISTMEAGLGPERSINVVVPYIPEAADNNEIPQKVVSGEILTERMRPIIARLQGLAQ